jgi:hypothetical protein
MMQAGRDVREHKPAEAETALLFLDFVVILIVADWRAPPFRRFRRPTTIGV